MPKGERAPREDAAPADGGLAQLCTFRVGGEDYAIDIMRLREIITPLPVTPVPRAPSFVEGVIRLHISDRPDKPNGPDGPDKPNGPEGHQPPKGT